MLEIRAKSVVGRFHAFLICMFTSVSGILKSFSSDVILYCVALPNVFWPHLIHITSKNAIVYSSITLDLLNSDALAEFKSKLEERRRTKK